MVLLGHFSKLLCSGTMPEEEKGRRDDLGGRLVCVWGGVGILSALYMYVSMYVYVNDNW